jgi:D-psicose/D-tagatose/L-ribulose 3-epimerase
VALGALDSPKLGAVLDVVSDLGYRRVVMPPLEPSDVDVERLVDEFAGRGLAAIPMVGQSPQADVSSMDPLVREAGSRAIRDAIEFASRLGSDRLAGVPYGLFGRAAVPPSHEAWQRSAYEVGLASEMAFERGITMTMEVLNRYETAMVNTAEQAMEYAEESGSDHLMIHLDTFHMAIEEADIAAAIRTALPRLAYLELGQSGRGLLSEGAIRIDEVVRDALGEGYRGRWGIEAFSASVLPREARSNLAIWRHPYEDGLVVAADAGRVIRAGWLASKDIHSQQSNSTNRPTDPVHGSNER